jgi:hypothetical protein
VRHEQCSRTRIKERSRHARERLGVLGFPPAVLQADRTTHENVPQNGSRLLLTVHEKWDDLKS